MTSDILNSRLPNIELSYGNILHRKVQCDLYKIIPMGVKCLIWYTYWKGDDVCYLLHLNNNSESINRVEKTCACFNKSLCYGKGTMLSGHLFTYNGVNVMAATDVHYYKGIDLYNEKNNKKQDILNEIMSKETRQNIYNNKQLLVALPITTTSYNLAIELAKKCIYPVHSISTINNFENNSVGYYKYTSSYEGEAFFLIKSQISCDTYMLYIENDNNPHGFAAITDYKTSKMMNDNFRTIRENNNLDLIEESDNEDDFENINQDKYVDLNKVLTVRCLYIRKFKKWKPINICSKETRLTSKREISIIEKNRR